MNRLHALAISVVLGAAGVAGAIAATQTMHLGAASAAPAQTDRAALRARSQRLDAWAKSLNSTLARRPPALPPVPQFGPVVAASFSSAVPVASRTAVPAARPTLAVKMRKHAVLSAGTAPRASSSSSRPPRSTTPRSDDPPASATPPTTAQPTDAAPAVVPVATSTPPPVATSPPSTGEGDDTNGGGDPQAPPEPGDDG